MKPKMRRFKQALDDTTCISILKTTPRGVLAMNQEGEAPYVIPLNHFYLNHVLYFHGAKQGYKLDLLAQNNQVSFCVYDEGFQKPGEWSLNIQSVTVSGTLEKVEDPKLQYQVLKALGMKFYPSEEAVEAEIQKGSAGVQLLALRIVSMSGKIVNES